MTEVIDATESKIWTPLKMCSETVDQTNTFESTPVPFSKVHVSYTVSAMAKDFQFLKIMTPSFVATRRSWESWDSRGLEKKELNLYIMYSNLKWAPGLSWEGTDHFYVWRINLRSRKYYYTLVL